MAEHRGTLYVIWAPSMFQGMIAGMHAAGRVAVEDGSFQILDGQRNGNYNRLVFRDGLLRGAILFGDAALSSELKQAIEDAHDFSGLLRGEPTSEQVLEHLAGQG